VAVAEVAEEVGVSGGRGVEGDVSVGLDFVGLRMRFGALGVMLSGLKRRSRRFAEEDGESVVEVEVRAESVSKGRPVERGAEGEFSMSSASPR
jgi:hypothetical protein